MFDKIICIHFLYSFISISTCFDVHTKIVGGKPTQINNHPYIVSIVSQGDHICGGAIINQNSILTAAHCFYQDEPRPHLFRRFFHVRSGHTYRLSKEGQTISIKEVTNHPLFNITTMDYDICVIKTENQITFNEQSEPINLPDSDFALPFGKEADVAGWGLVAHDGPLADILQTVSVTVWNQNDCLASYGDKITDNMFCAGDTLGRYDSCSGDSGGPLVYNQTILIGIVSWGTVCGKEKFPGIYTDVRKLLPWIQQYL